MATAHCYDRLEEDMHCPYQSQCSHSFQPTYSSLYQAITRLSASSKPVLEHLDKCHSTSQIWRRPTYEDEASDVRQKIMIHIIIVIILMLLLIAATKQQSDHQ
eukprot:scaffold10836_cov98-Skeletonema_marinoi.AAC.5